MGKSAEKLTPPPDHFRRVTSPPASLLDRAQAVLGATSLMASSMSCAVMEQWLLDGTADTIRQAVHEKAGRRNKLARFFLGPMIMPTRQDGHHVWLPMSRQEAERCDLAARTFGVLVTPLRPS